MNAFNPHEDGHAESLAMLAALPDAVLALWMKLLADGVTKHDSRLVTWSAIGLGVC